MTHACFAAKSLGFGKFKVAVLLLRLDAHIGKVVECSEGHQKEYILMGKILNPGRKPFAVAFNRGKFNFQMAATVRADRIYYDPNDGEEFRVSLPRELSNLMT